jgi:hypothetical protein
VFSQTNCQMTQSVLTKRVWRATTLVGYALGLVLYAIAWSPLAWWCSAVVAALRVRVTFGLWPRYGIPAVKHLAWVTGLEDAAFLACLTALVATSAFFAHRALRPRFTWVLLTPVAFLIGWGVFFVLLSVDPGGILEWATD